MVVMVVMVDMRKREFRKIRDQLFELTAAYDQLFEHIAAYDHLIEQTAAYDHLIEHKCWDIEISSKHQLTEQIASYPIKMLPPRKR